MKLTEFPTTAQIKQVLNCLCVKTMGKDNVPDGWDIDRIAAAIRRYCINYQIDPVLCLAQGIAESHFALNPKAKRSREHKNIFNWLNTDDGKNYAFATFEAGIEQYCKTMHREYYWLEDPDPGANGWVTVEMMIRHDFTRPIGGRYASAGNYTSTIASLAAKINKTMQGAL